MCLLYITVNADTVALQVMPVMCLYVLQSLHAFKNFTL